MRVNKEIIQKNLKEDIFVKISEASDDLGVDSYVVGGYVRDLCLRRPVKKDIDVMCVGSGIELAKNFYERIKKFYIFNSKKYFSIKSITSVC